jgi:hypothetical protein
MTKLLIQDRDRAALFAGNQGARRLAAAIGRHA